MVYSVHGPSSPKTGRALCGVLGPPAVISRVLSTLPEDSNAIPFWFRHVFSVRSNFYILPHKELRWSLQVASNTCKPSQHAHSILPLGRCSNPGCLLKYVVTMTFESGPD